VIMSERELLSAEDVIPFLDSGSFSCNQFLVVFFIGAQVMSRLGCSSSCSSLLFAREVFLMRVSLSILVVENPGSLFFARRGASEFSVILGLMSLVSRIPVGAMIGIQSGQCVGEPATQLTLNTFHLAGVMSAIGEGVPRLRMLILSPVGVKIRKRVGILFGSAIGEFIISLFLGFSWKILVALVAINFSVVFLLVLRFCYVLRSS